MEFLATLIALSACTVDLRDGKVVTTPPLHEKANECLAAVAQALSAQPGLSTVTVSVPPPTGGESDVLAPARRVRELLAANGVDAAMVSTNAPRGVSALRISYVARSLETVARVVGLVGTAAVQNEGEPRPLVLGAELRAGSRVLTDKESLVSILLADGSEVRIGGASEVELGALVFDSKLRKQVEVGLVSGAVDIRAAPAKAGSRFDVRTKNAIAGVKGTEFSVADPVAARTATYEGRVALSAGETTVELEQGFASQLAADGTVEPARALLAAPSVVGPLFGDVTSPVTLQWAAVEDAKDYIVEVARDPQFRRDVQMRSAETLSVELPLAAGKWYWRVSAIDTAEFRGFSSRVYGFTVR